MSDSSGPDLNLTTTTAYNAGNLLASATQTAYGSAPQTATHVCDPTAVTSTPALFCDDHVTAVIYADSTNTYVPGAPGSSSPGFSGAIDELAQEAGKGIKEGIKKG